MGSPQRRITCIALVSCLVLSIGVSQAAASQGSGGGPSPTRSPSPVPGASLSPSSLTYGAQEVGTDSAAQMVTLTNTGSAPLFINAMSQAGTNPLDFAETNDMCVGTSVAPGSSCTLSVIFKPTATGSRTATISVVDNAPNSPQVIALAGTGTSHSGPTPLTVNTQFMACTGGLCDLAPGGPVFVHNFFFSDLSANGGTSPFTWSIHSGALPPGITMTSSGMIDGTSAATGTYHFTVQVTDAIGSTATQLMTLTISPPPPPSPPGCQRAPSSVKEPLSGPPIAGKVPRGQAIGGESQLTACGGYTKLSVNVRNVNLPTGTVLWVDLDGASVGTITLHHGSGTMKPYNLGNFALRFNHIRIYDRPPPRVNAEPTVLSGGSFS